MLTDRAQRERPGRREGLCPAAVPRNRRRVYVEGGLIYVRMHVDRPLSASGPVGERACVLRQFPGTAGECMYDRGTSSLVVSAQQAATTGEKKINVPDGEAQGP